MKFKSIASKTFIIGCLFILILGGYLYLSLRFTHHVQDNGRRISLAGSERMRAFEIVYHLQNIHEYDRFRLEELGYHVQEFEEVFYAVRDGSEKWNMPKLRVENEQARKSIDVLIQRWHGEIKPYIEGAEKALKDGDISSYISNVDQYAERVHDYVYEINAFVDILVDDYRKDLKVHDVNMIVFFVVMAIFSLIVFIYFRRTALAPLQSLSETARKFRKGGSWYPGNG